MEGARKGTLRRVGAHWHWRSKVVWFFVWGSEHTTWDLGALGTRRLHRQAAWLHAPETPESLGPLLKYLVEWRKHNTDGAEPLQVCNISDHCGRRSETLPHGTTTREAEWVSGDE